MDSQSEPQSSMADHILLPTGANSSQGAALVLFGGGCFGLPRPRHGTIPRSGMACSFVAPDLATCVTDVGQAVDSV